MAGRPSTGAAECVIYNWRWNQYTQYSYLEVARTPDTCWSVALPKGNAFRGNSGITKVMADGNAKRTASAVVVKNPG